MKITSPVAAIMFVGCALHAAEDPPSPGSSGVGGFPKPYSPPCVERENIFEFTERPAVKTVGPDRYEITFAMKGNCDVTVGIVDQLGVVVRHVASGVLGANAPAPFQKNSLKQTVIWNGKDDLDEYHKDPSKLKAQVRLGLKPVFDKRLGGTSPHSLPGSQVWGIAVDADGAYVFSKNWQLMLRKFDRDGNYVSTLFPPAANTPESKLAGTGFIEYEPGKRAWHGRNILQSCADNGMVFPITVDYKSTRNCQVAIAGKRLFFTSAGSSQDVASGGSSLFYLYTDGSTDDPGMGGKPFAWGSHANPRLATPPDGKWIYMVDAGMSHYKFDPVVARAPADGSGPATVFVGERGKLGSDHTHLNGPVSIDCDLQGRVYVADSMNNRIQIFSPEAQHLKTIQVAGPRLLRVHQKTGAIYVQHAARVEGGSVERFTKFVSFENPVEEFHVDGISSVTMAVDAWSAKARLWLGGGVKTTQGYDRKPVEWYTVRILEEEGKSLRLLRDFDQEGRKASGINYLGFAGDYFDRVVCDPTREQVYYRNQVVFDLKTGALLGSFAPALNCVFDDMSFDKYGYAHLHFNPCFFGQGVGRVDPSRVSAADKAKGVFRYPECPYDYGVEALGWNGILPTKDQLGAKGFQDGLGVNMRGDVASECNIYYVPKMEETGWALAEAGMNVRRKAGMYVDSGRPNYSSFMRSIEEQRKRGEDVYAIPRRPGSPLSGGTIWTYERNGELRRECEVISGALVNGVQMDEDRKVYFVTNRPRLKGGKAFLTEKAGRYGGGSGSETPWTGTLMKTTGKPARLLVADATVPMEPAPAGPPDIGATWGGGAGYAEEMEWLYAGASPIVPGGGCSCPKQNLGLDWYKRTYVPEAYRHSIGILDSNGNLIMHLGQYGNFDDAPGGKNGAKPGGEDLRIMLTRFISATDNYLVYGDWAEKLLSLKLEYQAEESVGIGK